MISFNVAVSVVLTLVLIVFLVSLIFCKSVLTTLCWFGFAVDCIVALALVVFVKMEPMYYSTEVLLSVQPVESVTEENGVVTYNNLQDGESYKMSDYDSVKKHSTTMNEYEITYYRGIFHLYGSVCAVSTVRRFE